jgi:hypothetical protein
MSMQTNSQARWKLPAGLALAVLTVAAVALIPTVAFAGHDRAAPAAATHDHTMAGHTMAGHGMATLGAGLEDEQGAGDGLFPASTKRSRRVRVSGEHSGWISPPRPT